MEALICIAVQGSCAGFVQRLRNFFFPITMNLFHCMCDRTQPLLFLLLPFCLICGVV